MLKNIRARKCIFINHIVNLVQTNNVSHNFIVFGSISNSHRSISNY